MAETPLVFDGPPAAKLTVALAHGAGAPMTTPFLKFFAEGLAARGLQVARFEFPYMAARRSSGTRRPPDPSAVLLNTWREVIERIGPAGLVIGGKSLGGRMASMLADEMDVRGLICLGYPFHPPGSPERTRIEHLRTIRTPTLIVQGVRDPFGTREEVAAYSLPQTIRVHWLDDGDHGFAPRRASGRSLQQNLREALDAILAFLEEIRPPGGGG